MTSSVTLLERSRLNDSAFSKAGLLTAVTVLLTVLQSFHAVSGSFEDFYFITEPSDVIAVRSKPALLNCSAYHTSSVPRISWLQDGVLIHFDENQNKQKLANGSLFFSRVEHSQTHRPDEGLYQCVATVPSLGTIVSRKAKMQVAYLSRTFRESPASLSVHLGDMAMFACSVDGAPVPSIRWYKDEERLTTSADIANHFVHLDGTLEISVVRFTDFGRYQCRAENEERSPLSDVAVLSQDSNVSTYEGVSPRLLMRPKDTVALEGDTVLLHCAANGRDRSRDRPTITWLREGVTVEIPNADSRLSLAGRGSLRIDSVHKGDSGLYTCRVTNKEDSTDAEATLTVNVSPRLQRRPRNSSAPARGEATFHCSVDAYPEARISWLKDGEVLEASNYFQMSASGDELRLLGLIAEDAGMYQCLACNTVGCVQATAQLMVTDPGRTNPSRRDQPAAPRQLTAAFVSQRFITLSWQPPQHPGSSDVTGYSVFWQEQGSNRERELNTSRLEANIQQLRPATRYRFKVFAHNAAGQSRLFDHLSVETKTEVHVPGPVRSVTVAAISPTALQVNWQAPTHTAGELTRYRVYYYEVGLETQREQQVSASETSVTLKGLAPHRKHSIRLVACNTNGPGESSPEVIARTYSDVPSGAPQNVSVENTNSNSIVISWEPPLPSQQNGLITGYKIRYKRQGKKKAETITTDAFRRSYAITDLLRDTAYQLRIQALTVNGSGPATIWFYTQTLSTDLDEDRVPGAPTSLKVRPMTTSIAVSWTPPQEQDIMIRGYVLGYGIGSPYHYKQAVEAKQRYYTIKALSPSQQYVISLAAYNKIGEGQAIYDTVFTRTEIDHEPLTPMTPPMGLKAMVRSSSSVLLTWADTSLGGNQKVSDGRYYTLRFGAKTGRRQRQLNVTELNVLIEDLRPHTEYEFSVKVVKGRRQSTWSMSVVNRTFESAPTSAPRDLTLAPIKNRPSWVSLSWQPPKHTNGLITGYLILYTTDTTQDDRKWAVEAVLGEKLSTIIKGLTAETTYYFKIKARNDKGFGPLSSTDIYITPKEDGTGGGRVETPNDHGRQHDDYEILDGYGYGQSHNMGNYRDDGDRPQGISPLILWISIACVGGITIIAVLVVTVILCKRRMSENGRNTRKAGYMPANKGKMKAMSGRDMKPPPDLWMELKNMDKSGGSGGSGSGEGGATPVRQSKSGDDDTDSLTGSATGRRSESFLRLGTMPYDPHEDERYRRTPVRHKPIMIPVDQPPPHDSLPNGHLSGMEDNVSPIRQVYPRTQYNTAYANTPRVHAGDISQPNSGPQSPDSPCPQSTPVVSYDAAPPQGQVTGSGTKSLPRHPVHPLKSFTVPGPPSLAGTPTNPSPPKHIVKPTPQVAAYRKPPPPIAVSSAPGVNPRSAMPVNAPKPPEASPLTKSPGMAIPKAVSTEELTAEMASLEGLMKDLNAIRQQEFECEG